MYHRSLLTDGSPAVIMPLEADWVPPTLPRRGTAWRSLVGPGLSVAMLVAAVTQIRSLDVHRIWTAMPASPVFWFAMAGAYLALPVSEYVIYRRLWSLPIGGIAPLLRKRISNEIVFGYSGELYFYAWARRHANLVAAPFGAIKDVAILSAQVGNLTTLAMLALAWPSLGLLGLGAYGRDIMLSCAAVVAMSIPVMLCRRQLFTLPCEDLVRIAGIHLVRVICTMLLTAVAWHEAEPGVVLTWWGVLVAIRQLLSRLPLLPNKDIAFAAVAIYLVGWRIDLASMIAMTAGIILCAHLVLGAVLAVADLLTTDGRRG